MRVSALSRPALCFAAGILVALSSTALAQVGFSLGQTGFLQSFRDVPQGAYFSPSVQELVRKGIVQGYEDGRFGPEDFVTRAQVAVMIDRYDQQIVSPMREQIAELRAKGGAGRCADGTVQKGEQCDDGHASNGDGCSSECLPEKSLRFYYGSAKWTCQDGTTSSAEGECLQSWVDKAERFCEGHCGPSGKCGTSSFSVGESCNPNTTCAETDNGRDLNKKGWLTENGGTRNDHCVRITGDGNNRRYDSLSECSGDDCYLYELYCKSDNSSQEEYIKCASGCRDATCSQELNSTCGNGICEQGEAMSCPACVYDDPACAAVCSAGTCPQDCADVPIPEGEAGTRYTR